MSCSKWVLVVALFIATPSHAQVGRLGNNIPQASAGGSPPGQPFNPNPTNGATGQAVSLTLTWSCTGAGVNGWSVLGPDTTNPPTTNHGSLGSAAYTASGLSNSTTYYWQPTCTNAYGSTQLTTPWSFATAAAGATTLTNPASEWTFKGYQRLQQTGDSQNCALFGEYIQAFTAQRISGVVHYYITQQGTGNGSGYGYAPCEFSDPSTWSGSTCTANCPNTTIASAPISSQVVNWGFNNDGSNYSFYHGKVGQFYDGSNVLQTNCRQGDSTPASTGPGCAPWSIHISPDGVANGMYITYGGLYGNYVSTGGLMLVTLDNANSGGNRVTTAYAPWTLKGPVGSFPSDTNLTTGLWAGSYLLDMPDHTFGAGVGGSYQYQQHSSPNGPGLHTAPSWPTTSTSTAAGQFITQTKNYLHFYNLDGYTNTADCTLPNGQANWSWRTNEAYPYVVEVWNGNCDQGAKEAIDPQSSVGNKGTWSENDNASAMVNILTSTKRGVIAFLSTSTNHAAGNSTSCNGPTHIWYCGGSGNGRSGVPCAGANGDNKSPNYECTAIASVTGPTINLQGLQEGRWLVYDPNTLANVVSGTTTDYTVDASYTVFPETQWSLTMAPSGSLYPKRVDGAFYDTVTNLLYVALSEVDSATVFGQTLPVIAIFAVAQ